MAKEKELGCAAIFNWEGHFHSDGASETKFNMHGLLLQPSAPLKKLESHLIVKDATALWSAAY